MNFKKTTIFLTFLLTGSWILGCNSPRCQVESRTVTEDVEMTDSDVMPMADDSDVEMKEETTAMMQAPEIDKTCGLRLALAKLWSDHVFWTRLFIISAIGQTQDGEAAKARLLKNQTDLGESIVPYYGQEAGDKLGQLLTDHIKLSIPVVQAAMASDKEALDKAQQDWHNNADEIAQFLNKANPDNWGFEEMKNMLYDHLKLTTQEVVERLGKNWDNEVQVFDQIYEQALGMAKGLADGIIAQFPEKFQ